MKLLAYGHEMVLRAIELGGDAACLEAVLHLLGGEGVAIEHFKYVFDE